MGGRALIGRVLCLVGYHDMEPAVFSLLVTSSYSVEQRVTCGRTWCKWSFLLRHEVMR